MILHNIIRYLVNLLSLPLKYSYPFNPINAVIAAIPELISPIYTAINTHTIIPGIEKRIAPKKPAK